MIRPVSQAIGREPAIIISAVVGVIVAGLNLAAAFLLDWDPTELAAAISGVIVAGGFVTGFWIRNRVVPYDPDYVVPKPDETIGQPINITVNEVAADPEAIARAVSDIPVPEP